VQTEKERVCLREELLLERQEELSSRQEREQPEAE
jgi:hypothetical protein